MLFLSADSGDFFFTPESGFESVTVMSSATHQTGTNHLAVNLNLVADSHQAAVVDRNLDLRVVGQIEVQRLAVRPRTIHCFFLLGPMANDLRGRRAVQMPAALTGGGTFFAGQCCKALCGKAVIVKAATFSGRVSALEAFSALKRTVRPGLR